MGESNIPVVESCVHQINLIFYLADQWELRNGHELDRGKGASLGNQCEGCLVYFPTCPSLAPLSQYGLFQNTPMLPDTTQHSP